MIPRDNLNQINLDELIVASNWQQQYKLIIQWGKLWPAKAEIRTTAHLIRGCEVPVWLAHEYADGRHWWAFDADSSVIKGLAALLIVQVQGKSDTELMELDLTALLQQLGLQKHLSPSRSNGLNAIIERIRHYLFLSR